MVRARIEDVAEAAGVSGAAAGRVGSGLGEVWRPMAAERVPQAARLARAQCVATGDRAAAALKGRSAGGRQAKAGLIAGSLAWPGQVERIPIRIDLHGNIP